MNQHPYSLLRYPGGKTRAIPAISKHIHQGLLDHGIVSPFFGGGPVELHYARLGVNVWGGDLFRPIANFWTQASTNAEKMATLAACYHPLTKEDFKIIQSEVADDELITDYPTRSAAKFYVANRASFSGTTLSGGMGHDRFTPRSIEKLYYWQPGHLRSVDHRDYQATLADNPDAFAFCDPPYPIEKENLYGVRGDMHSNFDHNEFAAYMQNRDTPWIVCYNDTTIVRSMWSDYNIIPYKIAYGMSDRGDEILITNYDTPAQKLW